MDDRKSIAARIKALLSKTTDNGCTESEAMSSAAKARELMDKYHLDHGALGMEAEGTKKAEADAGTHKGMGLKAYLASTIATFCDCKVWKTSGKLVFFGLQSDVDFAEWLLESLAAFVQRSAAEYMHNIRPYQLNQKFKMPRWEAEKAFVIGAINRINERLAEMTKERNRAMQGDGKSLVVVKSALVNRAFQALNVKLGSAGRPGVRANDGGAFSAGQAAGDRASFGRPVGSDGGGQRLLR